MEGGEQPRLKVMEESGLSPLCTNMGILDQLRGRVHEKGQQKVRQRGYKFTQFHYSFHRGLTRNSTLPTFSTFFIIKGLVAASSFTRPHIKSPGRIWSPELKVFFTWLLLPSERPSPITKAPIYSFNFHPWPTPVYLRSDGICAAQLFISS